MRWMPLFLLVAVIGCSGCTSATREVWAYQPGWAQIDDQPPWHHYPARAGLIAGQAVATPPAALIDLVSSRELDQLLRGVGQVLTALFGSLPALYP